VNLKTVCALTGLAAIAACAHAGTRADDKTDGTKQFAIWVGGPLELEYNLQDQPISIGVGFAGVLSSSNNSSSTGNTSSSIGIGPEIELNYFTAKQKSGLMVNLRFGSASMSNSDGTSNGSVSYFGPGVYYVSRPSSSVAFRIGLSFPFGSDVAHIYPEMAFGFQF